MTRRRTDFEKGLGHKVQVKTKKKSCFFMETKVFLEEKKVMYVRRKNM